MRPFRHILLLIALTLPGAHAYMYMPPPVLLLPVYSAPTHSCQLDSLAPEWASLAPGGDTLLHRGDSIDVLIPGQLETNGPDTLPKTSLWQERFPATLCAALLQRSGNGLTLIPGTSFDTSGSFDTLKDERGDVVLPRPGISSVRFSLATGSLIQRAATFCAKDSLAKGVVRDIVVPWGVYDRLQRRWIGWGRTSLRRDRDEWPSYDLEEAAFDLSLHLIDSTPLRSASSAYGRMEAHHRWGGVHIGIGGFPEFHWGDLKKRAHELDPTSQLSAATFDLEVGWFPAASWGLLLHIPFRSSVSFDEPTSNGTIYLEEQGGHASSGSTDLVEVFAPRLEAIGRLPIGNGRNFALYGSLSASFLSVEGKESAWQEPSPSGFGWSVGPEVGMWTNLGPVWIGLGTGLEFQRYSLGSRSIEESLFRFTFRTGFRLHQD